MCQVLEELTKKHAFTENRLPNKSQKSPNLLVWMLRFLTAFQAHSKTFQFWILLSRIIYIVNLPLWNHSGHKSPAPDEALSELVKETISFLRITSSSLAWGQVKQPLWLTGCKVTSDYTLGRNLSSNPSQDSVWGFTDSNFFLGLWCFPLVAGLDQLGGSIGFLSCYFWTS